MTKFRLLDDLDKKLKLFGNPALRVVCTPFTSEELLSGVPRKIVAEMEIVLRNTNKLLGLGRALASNQLGYGKSVFITYSPKEDVFKHYINSKILKKSEEKASFREMCLSGVPLAASVVRPKYISMSWLNLEGEAFEEDLGEFLSRVAQHEIDHLNGVIFTDRADIKDLSIETDWGTYKRETKLIDVS